MTLKRENILENIYDLFNDDATETGTSTSEGSGTLTDTSKTWTANEWAGGELTDSAGTVFNIASNTATVLTLDGSGTPASGAYTITWVYAVHRQLSSSNEVLGSNKRVLIVVDTGQTVEHLTNIENTHFMPIWIVGYVMEYDNPSTYINRLYESSMVKLYKDITRGSNAVDMVDGDLEIHDGVFSRISELVGLEPPYVAFKATYTVQYDEDRNF